MNKLITINEITTTTNISDIQVVNDESRFWTKTPICDHKDRPGFGCGSEQWNSMKMTCLNCKNYREALAKDGK